METSTENTIMENEEVTTVETETTKPAESRTVTGEELSRHITRETRRAMEKLLLDAGITPGDNPEMKFKEYKKWLDSQKSELEIAQTTLATLERERDAAVGEATSYKNQFLVLKKDIPDDKAEEYLRLASAYLDEDTDMEKALDKLLEVIQVQSESKGVPGVGGNPPPVDTTKDFSTMTSEERIELRQKDPALYKKLRDKFIGG